MTQKPYRLGIIVGRFQTFHTGHESMIDKAVQLCEKVGVFVGSSQEQGTMKNPFSYSERERILRKVFGDKIEIYPLPDVGLGNNSKWGDYVLKNVKKRFDCLPDIIISGKEGRRIDWFDSEEGFSIAELYVPKTIYISATTMREHLINDDFTSFKVYTNEILWDEYENFRNTVLKCKDNLITDSI
jgi:cytidyltransferase-like protein